MEKNKSRWSWDRGGKLAVQMLLSVVDINIHVRINDTQFSYASVDFPRAPLLCLIAAWGSSPWGTVTRPLRCALQYVTVANFRGTLSTTGDKVDSFQRVHVL